MTIISHILSFWACSTRNNPKDFKAYQKHSKQNANVSTPQGAIMILGTFLQAIATIASMLFNLYIWILIIATLISWVRPDPYNPIVQVLYRLSEPVFAKVRKLIPTNIGGLDFAPLIVIVALKFIDLTLIQILYKFAKAYNA